MATIIVSDSPMVNHVMKLYDMVFAYAMEKFDSAIDTWRSEACDPRGCRMSVLHKSFDDNVKYAHIVEHYRSLSDSFIVHKDDVGRWMMEAYYDAEHATDRWTMYQRFIDYRWARGLLPLCGGSDFEPEFSDSDIQF